MDNLGALSPEERRECVIRSIEADYASLLNSHSRREADQYLAILIQVAAERLGASLADGDRIYMDDPVPRG
jgi:hypothetical protein